MALKFRGKGEGVRIIYLTLAHIWCVGGGGRENLTLYSYIKNRFLKNISSCGVVFSRLRIPWKTCVLTPISSS